MISGGKQPHEKHERNREIYLGWKEGMTFRELGERHGISRQAAHGILVAFKRKHIEHGHTKVG